MDPARHPRQDERSGIPRARGDGPVGLAVGVIDNPDSPRSRGWTLGVAAALAAHRGFPALAGMDLERPHGSATSRRIPRARGDGPQPGVLGVNLTSDSPRSRGWTLHWRHRCGAAHGFPALAGMDPGSRVLPRHTSRIPRARGDGPSRMSVKSCCRPDSPRSRGWTRAAPPASARRAGFPALAGMDRSATWCSTCRAGIPRARGDGPDTHIWECRGLRDSPRSRGWTGCILLGLNVDDGFPALAGMDPPRRLPLRLSQWIPRARGDGPRHRVDRRVRRPDSPRSRGWTLRL